MKHIYNFNTPTKVLSTLLLLLSLVTSSIAATQTMTLRLQSTATAFLDETSIFFSATAVPQFVANKDVVKIDNILAGAPSFYSFSKEGTPCLKNGFGTLTNTEVVPLGFKVSINGEYRLTMQTILNFDPTSIVRLEDRQMGSLTNIRTDFYLVSLKSTDTDSGRFYIHVTRPAVFTYENSGCLNNEGSITVTIDPSVAWDICQLYDTANNPLITLSNVTSVANFSGLGIGTYYVAFLSGQYSSGKYFTIGGSAITTTIQTPIELVLVGQEATFHSSCTNTDQYNWDFGDGTLITGVANPSQTYFASGTYTINLICSNTEGCSSTSQITVTVGMPSAIANETSAALRIFAHGQSIQLNRDEATNGGTSVRVYNLIGEPVYTTEWNNTSASINLDSQPAGYYIVSVKEANNTNTRRVYLGR